MRRLNPYLLIIAAVLIPGGVRGQVAVTASGRSVVTEGAKTVAAGTRIPRSIATFGGNLDIYGTVGRNATAIGGDVIVHKGGRVNGKATAIGGVVRLEGGTVGGRVRTIARDADFRGFASYREFRGTRDLRAVRVMRHTPLRSVGIAVTWLLIVTLVGFALMAFGPDKLEIVIETMQNGVGKSLLTGLFGQLAIVPGAIAVVALLAVTIIGIVLIPLGLMAFMFAVAGIAMFGFIAAATMTGAALTRDKSRDNTPHGRMLRAFLTGSAVYMGLWLLTAALSGVPLLGAVLASFTAAVTFIAITTGFGAVLLSYWRGEFKRTAVPTAG
ncbi:MAG TPA: hypothetical protein VM053_05115 [Gemmatimonadaceae bacterium]|nr:hypothetical protein [Gemmatimonadaceae bacterium]